MIIVKDEKELVLMRKAGQIVARTLKEIESEIKVGITTQLLNDKVEKLIIKMGGIPAFKGYRGYNYATCVSVNEVVVHGIPGIRQLFPGDIVSLDVGVIYNGFNADKAVTYGMGELAPDIKKLVDTSRECLKLGINQAREENRLGDISSAIQEYAEKNGFNVVRDLFGHGIGRNLHEDPLIPNFGTKGDGIKLRKGMTFAIEPMLNMGTHEIETLDDGWTVVTKDRKWSAHFEDTIVITENEPEILTRE
jgi:methionyl aminopeptidase